MCEPRGIQKQETNLRITISVHTYVHPATMSTVVYFSVLKCYYSIVKGNLQGGWGEVFTDISCVAYERCNWNNLERNGLASWHKSTQIFCLCSANLRFRVATHFRCMTQLVELNNPRQQSRRQVDASFSTQRKLTHCWLQVNCICVEFTTFFCENPFGHPSQVRVRASSGFANSVVSCVGLRRFASPFGQGLKQVGKSPKFQVYTINLRSTCVNLRWVSKR